MKRKDFLRKMRNRRRGKDDVEKREPERRRAADWRTLRVDLPADDEPDELTQDLPVGELHVRRDGIVLVAEEGCWVRGFRRYASGGVERAEFQYRPAAPEDEPPPGCTSLAPGDAWERP